MRLSLGPAHSGSAPGVLLGTGLAACAVSGHGPLWMLPVWALALGLWSLNERRRSLVLALPLLLALVPAWPWHAEPLAFTAQYLRVALAGLAAALYVQTLDERSTWWGLAALSVAWVLAPTPLGLFGLLGAALLRAQTVQRGHQQAVSGRAVGWLLGVVALVALGSALLPRPELPTLGTATQGQAASPRVRPPPDPEPRPVPQPSGAASAQPRYAPLPPLASFELQSRLAPSLLLAFALLSTVLLLLAWREGRKRPGNSRLQDAVLAAGLVVAYLMLALYFAVRARGGVGGAAGQGPGLGHTAAGGGPTTLSPAPAGVVSFLNAVGWIGVVSTLLFLLLAVLGAVLLLRTTSPSEGNATSKVPASSQRPEPSPEHRVRRAYRLMLSALAAAGLARVDTETPQEYLTRLAAHRPELAGAARRITGAYEPVRYGAQTDEAGAQAAENALNHLQSLLERPA